MTEEMSSKSKSQLAAAAKKTSAELKGLLKHKDVTSKQVELCRVKLRKTYSSLLPLMGDSSRGLDVIGLLWQDTSHAFIHRYRQKISTLDKQLASQKHAPRGSHNNTDQPPVGPTARRKLVQSFRAFLAAEEEFWSELIVQLVVQFDIKEALPCLSALGITSSQLGSERAASLILQEDPTLSPLDTTHAFASKQRAILLCHRAFICFGDLARYRELYNERSPSKKTDSTEGSHVAPKWARAAEAYHQARLLVPGNGNPSNQLAVIASYSQDTLSSVYHYYRAICVTQVFKEARPNLGLTFKKILAKYSADGSMDAKLSIYQAFVDEFTLLHAKIFLRHSIESITTQAQKTLGFYSTCLSRRLVSSEAIVKVLCTCLAARFDIIVHGSGQDATQDVEEQPSVEHLKELEREALQVILEFIQATMKASEDSVNSMADQDDANMIPLSNRIAPVLRRALPAIRIASKWILGQSAILRSATDFWAKYVQFVESLSQAFSMQSLPQLPVEMVLEENIDMAGFLPVNPMLRASQSNASVTVVSVVNASHPNEEHLMRVADILADAALLASNPALMVKQENGHFVTRVPLNPVAQEFTASFFPSISPYDVYEPYDQTIEEDEDDLFEEDTLDREGSTDADIVDLAMRAATMATDEDNEDDQILFPSKTSPSTIGRLLPDRSSPAQTASDLLLQVLNGSSEQPSGLTRRTSEVSNGGSPDPAFSNIISGSIWAPNASELPPPTAANSAAWTNSFAAAPQRPLGHQQHFPYG